MDYVVLLLMAAWWLASIAFSVKAVGKYSDQQETIGYWVLILSSPFWCILVIPVFVVIWVMEKMRLIK